MKQADKMALIRDCLENGFPSVMTRKGIAVKTGLSYKQVNSALLIHFRSEFKFTPFTHEFRCIGNRYQEWIYSTKRCDPELSAK